MVYVHMLFCKRLEHTLCVLLLGWNSTKGKGAPGLILMRSSTCVMKVANFLKMQRVIPYTYVCSLQCSKVRRYSQVQPGTLSGTMSTLVSCLVVEGKRRC